MRKTFVLDTNVPLHDPKCLESFKGNDIILPSILFEELDKFKNSSDLVGFYAREFLRTFDKLRNGYSVLKGISLKNGSVVFVRVLKNINNNITPEFEISKSDNIILKIVKECQSEFENVVLVSKDTNLRIKAEILGLESEDYQSDKQRTEFLDNDGIFITSDELIDSIYEEGKIDTKVLLEHCPFATTYVILKSINKKSVILKEVNDHYERFVYKNYNVFGIKPSNIQQQFLLDALFSPEIKIVFATGIAGTGKTLNAIASGFTQTTENIFNKLIISRSPVPMGRDLGYLPGSLNEKLDPWLMPIYDNLELILQNVNSKKKTIDNITYSETTIDYLKSSGILEITSLPHIRGRTFNNAFILIDEAQNLTNHELKTILTRVGKNSKIVFTGDVYQIDTPYLSIDDNGLTVAASKFRNRRVNLASFINLTKSERSEVAALAAEIL